MDLAAATSVSVTAEGVAIRTLDPVAGVASAQLIDVSNFQGTFNWKSAKAAVPNLAGGMYRLTQGLGGPGMNSPDPFAAWNHREIRDNGLHPGSYHFLDPLLSGKDQASYYVDEQGKLGFTATTMLWCDNETHGMSGSQVADCAAAFMDQVKALRPSSPMGVYTYLNFAQTGNDGGLGRWPLWLADVTSTGPSAPPPWTKWTFWQWGTRFAGGQTVDADAFNGTVADFTGWLAGFGGPSPHIVADGVKTLDELAQAAGRTPSGLLRRTAIHFGAFDPATAAFIGRVAGPQPVDKGANLWSGN